MRCAVERFEEKIEKIPIAGCWIWTGATYRRGYGHFRNKVDGRWVMYKAHRFSYETYIGAIPEGLSVLHKCDVPACVNPHHLFVGTTADNHKDMHDKGRRRFGRKAEHKHLNKEWADQIRYDWQHCPKEMTQMDLARAHGISTTQMSRILQNQIWK